MNECIYLESSVVELKPRVLDFLSVLVEKAKEAKDYVLALKKKELAEAVGRDVRTVTRYLKTLEKEEIIQIKGRKGRAGGTVILFNPEYIKFETSEKALVNLDNVDDIERIMEEKYPKKEQEQKPNKRKRRTKKQMIEAQILQEKRNSKLKSLNDDIERLGGIPNWEWFKKTDDPVGNYRTYLLSRLYNRYAVLFTDWHNSEVMNGGEGNKVAFISNDYDVLPLRFYGSSRWYQFEKLRKFLEENRIEPAPYLSAQFSRSVFDSSRRKTKDCLPFVNALISDTCYEAYLQYCDYQKKVSHTYAAYQVVPARFMGDFVVQAIADAYRTAESGNGFLEIRWAVDDFLTGESSSDREDALLAFYRITDRELKNKKVSFKTRDTIKKYLVLQSLIQTGGVKKLPKSIILGLEMSRAVLKSISDHTEDKEQARYLRKYALGVLTHPDLTKEEQVERGGWYNYQYNVLYETPHILRLIMERKGMYISMRELNEAFKEYGRDKIPVDDYSMLDVDQIVRFVSNKVEVAEPQEIRHEDIVEPEDWLPTGAIGGEDPLAEAFQEMLQENEK